MPATKKDATTAAMDIDWDGEVEYSARIELRRVHIDEAMYDFFRIERKDGHLVVVFKGVGYGKEFPQASVTFKPVRGAFDVRVVVVFLPSD